MSCCMRQLSRNVGVDDFGIEAPLSVLPSNVCARFSIRLIDFVLMSFPVSKVIPGSLLLKVVRIHDVQ